MSHHAWLKSSFGLRFVKARLRKCGLALGRHLLIYREEEGLAGLQCQAGNWAHGNLMTSLDTCAEWLHIP